MHLLGAKAVTEQVFPNGSARVIALDDPFNPHSSPFSQMTFLKAPVRTHRGDALQYTCLTDSRKRMSRTVLGVLLMDEMCFSYMLISPALDSFTACWHVNPFFKPTPPKWRRPCGAVSSSAIPKATRDVAPFVMPIGRLTAHVDPAAASIADRDVCQAPST
ncbi:hypothetical protein T492DRAFT_55663 [Pavlovales sp. CCMP2436]|nr:hypothetical protein T492DRAFT_55663 [Pavlovales sp. CCMP2436]